MSNLITIKGSREGLRLQLDESVGWPEVVDALGEQLDRGTHFFNGARIVIDIGQRPLAEEQLAALLELMRQHGLEPDSLISATRESRNAARAAGIATRPVPHSVDPAEERAEATFVWRTIRSGQVIRHQGHVTVLGDINPGGEIIAGGTVIVWGRLRGTVHAGALGDRSAVICALELTPTQLRIADLIARTPDSAGGKIPEVAHIQGEQINVTAWFDYRK